jgi:hypothetical protein
VAGRSEASIVFLVLAAAGCVLAAPVIGRLGAPGLADAAMGLAAGCGVGAFGVAAVSTFRAARTTGGRAASHEVRR